MRRLATIGIAATLVIALFTPAAFASLTAFNSHACCHRALNRHDCGETQAGWSAKADCHSCCFALGLRERSPRALAVARWNPAPAPSAHPILDEFFPAAATAEIAGPQAPRAPPATSR